MTRFWMGKVAPFFKTLVKVENGENDDSTFPNGFLDLSQLFPTLLGAGKVAKTTTFQLFPPIYRGKVKKSMVQVETQWKNDSNYFATFSQKKFFQP
jgi:hypothetical protein